MRQFLLAAALVLGAVGLFFGGRALVPGAAVDAAVLGDLTDMQTIVADVAALADTGDLTAAKVRIADLETAWDDAEPEMRPKNPEAWGRVDEAADAALSALRAGTPDATAVATALVTLAATLANPGAGEASPGGVQMVGDVAVTDANGHALPCEAMLKDIAAKPAPTGDKAATVADLVAKATERCNADDDTRANAFSAAALADLATN